MNGSPVFSKYPELVKLATELEEKIATAKADKATIDKRSAYVETLFSIQTMASARDKAKAASDQAWAGMTPEQRADKTSPEYIAWLNVKGRLNQLNGDLRTAENLATKYGTETVPADKGGDAATTFQA